MQLPAVKLTKRSSWKQVVLEGNCEERSREDAEITKVEFFSQSSAQPREPVLTRNAEDNYDSYYLTSPNVRGIPESEHENEHENETDDVSRRSRPSKHRLRTDAILPPPLYGDHGVGG